MSADRCLTGAEFCKLMSVLRYNFFTGVPDSTLRSAWKILESDLRYLYVSSVREDNAVGLAVGAYLGGKCPVVLMQSSGFGNCLDALTSLAFLYKVPLLFIVGWRGATDADAPEHILMGSVLPALLTDIGMPFWIPTPEDLAASLNSASHKSRSESHPAALLIRQGVLG